MRSSALFDSPEPVASHASLKGEGWVVRWARQSAPGAIHFSGSVRENSALVRPIRGMLAHRDLC